MSNDKLEKILEEAWLTVCDRFYNPNLSAPPKFEPVKTACFKFRDNTISVDPNFIRLTSNLGLDEKTTMIGLLMHELGHYMNNPRDISRVIMQAEAAYSYFPNEPENVQNTIVNYYSDVADNLQILCRQEAGRELRELLLARQNAPNCAVVFKVLNAFYAGMLPDFNVPEQLSPEHKEVVSQLNKINFLDEQNENVAIYQFGSAILKLLKKDFTTNSSSGNPLGGTLVEQIPGLTNEQIENALNRIATKHGLNEYERIKKFIKKKTGNKFGREKTGEDSQRIAGIESSDLSWNNDLIDYYFRKASGIGVYIFKKPLIVDARESYPGELEKFKIGDDFSRINPFSSKGILPGITSKFKVVAGLVKDRKLSYPDLFVSLDTSGSMEHPRNPSIAVLAAYILGINYHKNGSCVGMNNFSTNCALLFPSREINDFFRLACAYFGGGTVYDTTKLKDYFTTLARNPNLFKKHGLKGITLSSEEDYRNLLARLDPKSRKEFERKEITVCLDRQVKEIYERLDHIMITDGEIMNIQEVIDYVASTAKYTRHTVIVIKNPACAAQWRGLKIKNTQIVDVDSEESLIGLAVGRIKSLAPAEPKKRYF